MTTVKKPSPLKAKSAKNAATLPPDKAVLTGRQQLRETLDVLSQSDATSPKIKAAPVPRRQNGLIVQRQQLRETLKSLNSDLEKLSRSADQTLNRLRALGK